MKRIVPSLPRSPTPPLRVGECGDFVVGVLVDPLVGFAFDDGDAFLSPARCVVVVAATSVQLVYRGKL